MNLRPHQAQLQAICQEILAGAPISTVIAAVTPGGGKSKMPVILASMLIPAIADRIVWVAPRNALKYQGEVEFLDPKMPTDRRMRAANGNDANPDRGTDGYLTTYQAIGMAPGQHAAYCRQHRTILFLDEPHHCEDGQSWAQALAPMVNAAALVVYASGTLSRGDGQKIAGLEYAGGQVDLSDREHVRVIRYGRRQAIQDGAVLQVQAKTIDGAAEWVNLEGESCRTESLATAGDDRSSALFAMLRTGYAYQLMDSCVADWEQHRLEYPAARLLVVATDIETARAYHAHIARRHLAEIATSEDSTRARQVIQEYKRGVFPVLVTVAMAYEGLSVPEITHTACLTHIRSVPWLEQCFARANRRAPGKTCAVVWGPADELFQDAMRTIEAEKLIGLREKGESELSGGGEGAGRPGIKPLWSSAHGLDQPEINQARPIAESDAEQTLIDNIRAIKRDVLSRRYAGGFQAAERLIGYKIRAIANKKLEDMDRTELTQVWQMLRAAY
jgi:superfamily II DNA or RNA helicase